MQHLCKLAYLFLPMDNKQSVGIIDCCILDPFAGNSRLAFWASDFGAACLIPSSAKGLLMSFSLGFPNSLLRPCLVQGILNVSMSDDLADQFDHSYAGQETSKVS